MIYAAGLDGGGTKTAVELLWQNGETKRAVFGSLNLNGSSEQAVFNTVTEICKWMSAESGGLSGCKAVCVGGAGISNSAAAECIRAALKNSGITAEPLLTGDDQTALAGAFNGKDGAVLIAGTGSICCGRKNGEAARSGGWGYLLDDEGGGYAIGRDILTAVLRALDKRAAPTALTPHVFKALGANDAKSIISAVYSAKNSKEIISGLAFIIDSPALFEDFAALEIRQKAARELSLLVKAVLGELCLEEGPIALMGSILMKSEPIRQETQKQIIKLFPLADIRAPLSDAAHGAALLAEKAITK